MARIVHAATETGCRGERQEGADVRQPGIEEMLRLEPGCPYLLQPQGSTDPPVIFLWWPKAADGSAAPVIHLRHLSHVMRDSQRIQARMLLK